MLGSDKHHTCLKGTNINGLSPSYHKQAYNDRGILSRKHKSFRLGFEKNKNKKDQPTGLIPILRQ